MTDSIREAGQALFERLKTFPKAAHIGVLVGTDTIYIHTHKKVDAAMLVKELGDSWQGFKLSIRATGKVRACAVAHAR